jgi:phenylacetate-CoA ligase
VLDAAMASMRFAASTLFGRPFSQRSLERLYRAAVETQSEFGHLGAESSGFLAGPAWDDDARRFFQGRRFRSQALRGARETEYYRKLFASLGVDPGEIDTDDIAAVPVTPKQALREDPEAFVRRTAKLGVRATTTGTTGWPTSVYFSHAELRAMSTLSSLGFLAQGLIAPDDLVQISISTRNALGVRSVAAAAAGIGAGLHVAGLIEPEHTLRLLAERHRHPGKKARVSVMSTYPSYLEQLVERGRRLGYGPDDFGLERVLSASEIVTEGLRRRAREVFGPIEIVQSYAMTELAPMGADVCSEGHLHFEPSIGLVEVVRLDGGGRAGDGEAGTIVATPFAPFRESTVLLRYDTEDVVEAIERPLTCELRNLPATSNVLGRKGLSARHDHGWTFPRQVLDALDAVEEVPAPARFGFWAVPGGVAVEVLVRNLTANVRARIDDALHGRGIPVCELRLVEDRRELRQPLPLRCDIGEAPGETGGLGLSPADDRSPRAKALSGRGA